MLPANTAWLEPLSHTPRIPRLGEHRDIVLTSQLGYSSVDLSRLEAAGAFGTTQSEAATEAKSENMAAGTMD
jgi:formyl-CoA transferase